MRSRLVAYGRIQKGRPERYLVVVLDERFCEVEDSSGGLLRGCLKWQKGLRIQPGQLKG